MATAKLFDNARMTTATTGTGTITLGSAYDASYFTFAEAGVSNSDVVTYLIQDSLDIEIGRGTYTSSGTTLSRDTVIASRISGTAGTSKINLSGSANVSLVASKSDLDVNDFTAETAPATGDLLWLYDASASDRRKMTLENMLKVVNSLTEDTAPDVAADFVLTYDASASGVKRVKPVNLAKGFFAHKNGTAQTGIANTTFTKITFGTETFDIGSYYDTSNSRWTPPAGRILIGARLYWSGGVNINSGFQTVIYKNGSYLTGGLEWASTTAIQTVCYAVLDTNGTDYYEIYGYGGTASSLTVDGTTGGQYTAFFGTVL